MRAEQNIAIAHKLYEARRTLRRLMGDSYQKYANNWMDVVDAIASGEGQSHLVTAMKLLADLQAKGDDGMAQLWVLAATVELTEPDELTPAKEEDDAD